MVDSTKMLSQQTLVRAGTSNNPLGLYNYESFNDVIPWGLIGWPSIINGNINIVKVNNICTFTINIINNPNSGVIASAEINGGSYRLPKRFWPLNTDGLTHYAFIHVTEGAGGKLGSFEIYNNTGNVNDPLNGRIRFGAVNSPSNGFTNANGRPLTSSFVYETKSILNE